MICEDLCPQKYPQITQITRIGFSGKIKPQISKDKKSVQIRVHSTPSIHRSASVSNGIGHNRSVFIVILNPQIRVHRDKYMEHALNL